MLEMYNRLPRGGKIERRALFKVEDARGCEAAEVLQNLDNAAPHMHGISNCSIDVSLAEVRACGNRGNRRNRSKVRLCQNSTKYSDKTAGQAFN